MELPIYETLEDFKSNLTDHFADYDKSFISYLKEYKQIYDEVWNEYETKISGKSLDVFTQYSKKNPNVINGTDWGGFHDKMINVYETLKADVKMFPNVNLLSELILEREYSAKGKNLSYNPENVYCRNIESITDFIAMEIERERINIMRKQPTTAKNEEVEIIAESDTNKIRMLHKTGIIDYLLAKYGATTNTKKIAEFFEFLTTPNAKGNGLISKNTNTLFTTDTENDKYPMRNINHSTRKKIQSLMDDFGFEQ